MRPTARSLFPVILLLLVLAPMLAAGLATAAAADDRPPTDLRWHGDHWSAWDAPPPPPDARVHIIQRGDTLWDLAAGFYGDPYLWPQLWEQNQYILDAHWIYPGDPLVVGGAGLPLTGDQLADVAAPALDSPEALAAAEPDAAQDDADDETASARGTIFGTDGPVPLGFESDIYCSGYIGEEEEPFAFRVAGSEYDFTSPSIEAYQKRDITGTFGTVNSEKVGLTVGDIAYLDGGRAEGLSPGDLLVALRPAGLVRHPHSNETVGRYYQYTGRLRVLSVQDSSAIAEVVMNCDMVLVGSTLKPFEPEPVPLRRRRPMRPVNFPAPSEALDQGASIIYSKDTAISLSSGHLVFIDRGEDHDVVPGDVFTVYRRTREGLPPIVLGEVGVLSTSRHTALARILNSRYTVYIGDALLPK